MKRLIAVACVLCLAAGARAQEKVPAEMAHRFAKLFASTAGKEGSLPSAEIDVDPSKAVALKKGEAHALVIPDKKLSADEMDQLNGKSLAPVGQLWLRHLVPEVGGKRAAEDALRIIHVKVNDQDHPLPMLRLAARKGPDGLQLMVYGKYEEPLEIVPLKKVDEKQEEPIDLGAKDVQDERGTLVLTILGKWQADLPVAKAQD